VIPLLIARDTTAAPNHNQAHQFHQHHLVILLLTVMGSTAAAPNQPNVILLHSALDTIAALVIPILRAPWHVLQLQTVVLNRPLFHLFYHHVPSVVLVLWVSIAVHVIPILVVPWNVLPVGTVVSHRHHHPVRFVVMVWWVSIAVLVIPILVAPLNVLTVETVALDRHLFYHHHLVLHQEKNATKSAISLDVKAAVAAAVVRVEKEERVEKVDTTAVVATTVDSVVATMVVKVEKEARVDTTVVAVVDTKFVNSSVNWCMTNIRRTNVVAVGRYIFHSCGTLFYNISLNEMSFNKIYKLMNDYERFSTNLYCHGFCFCRYSDYQYCI